MSRDQPDPPTGEQSQLEKGRFLTDTQRAYLMGGHDPPTDNAESTMRTKIRHRTVGAILELGVVARNLKHRDRELLFNYATEEEWSVELEKSELFPEYRHGKWGDIGFVVEFSDIIQFFWKTYRESGATRGALLKHFEQWTQKAEHEYRQEFEYQEGWEERGKLPTDVEADFNMKTVDDVDVDSLLGRLDPNTDAGRSAVSELSGLEMKALVESGHADIRLKD